MREPRILASFVQSTLDAADRADARLGARLRSRLAPATLRSVEDAASISFLPVALDVEVTECLFAEAGEERAREVMRSNLASTFEAPVLASLVSAATRMLGREPARLFRWSPKVWGQLYRDAGELRWIEAGPSAGRLVYEGLPAQVVASRPYLVGVEAALSATFELLGVEGEVRLSDVDPRLGRAMYELSWKR
jgi:hypothetical protein